MKKVFLTLVLAWAGALSSASAQPFPQRDTLQFTVARSPWSITSQSTLLLGMHDDGRTLVNPQYQLGATYTFNRNWSLTPLIGFTDYLTGSVPLRLGAQGVYTFPLRMIPLPNPRGYLALGLGLHRTLNNNRWWSPPLFVEEEKLRGWIQGSGGLQWNFRSLILRTGVGYQIQQVTYDGSMWWLPQSTLDVRFRRMTFDLSLQFPLQKTLSIISSAASPGE